MEELEALGDDIEGGRELDGFELVGDDAEGFEVVADFDAVDELLLFALDDSPGDGGHFVLRELGGLGCVVGDRRWVLE